MRGRVDSQRGVLCLIDPETLIDRKHPIREVKRLCDEVLRRLEPEFAAMYAERGRPSVPPERLLLAWVLIALFGVRSCRMFSEQLRYNLLFKWFLDMNPDEDTFDASTFSKNLERFRTFHVSELFFAEVVELARSRGWVSDEHFSVDGTLIEAWASFKSFRPKDEPPPPPGPDRNGWSDFKGQSRSNDTHASTTDPEAHLLRKGAGKEARLCFGAHAVADNRNNLCVLFDIRPACGPGNSEADVALGQVDELCMRGFEPRTIGADKGYHTKGFVEGLRDREVHPHVARVPGRRTPGLDGRHARGKAYQLSLKRRRRIEEIFGWMKTVGHFRRTRHRGVDRTHFIGQFVASAYNLVRMAKLSFEGQSPPLCNPA